MSQNTKKPSDTLNKEPKPPTKPKGRKPHEVDRKLPLTDDEVEKLKGSAFGMLLRRF